MKRVGLSCIKNLFLSLICTLALITPVHAQSGPISEDAVTAWSGGSTALGSGHVLESSPIIVDLDGDGRAEVILGTTAQKGIPQTYTATPRLVVANADGSIRWFKNLDAPVTGSPAVGDIDGDGDLEIVVPLGGDVVDTDNHGGMIAFDHTGKQLWRFTTQDHAGIDGTKDGFADGVRVSPTLCDMDGDGDLEIAFGSFDQRIYLLDHNGNSLWNNLPSGTPTGPGFYNGYYNADSIWSSPACADFNGDGSLELVIGAAITGGGYLPDGTLTSDGGFLYVFDRLGTVLARKFIPEDVQSSPAIGDLDGDGTLEIVVGTGWFWWNAHGRTATSYVHAFDTSKLFGNLPYADANKLPNFPGWPQSTTSFPGFSSPALADLDGDGTLEIVIGAGDPFRAGSDPIPGAGRVYAWHHNGQAVAGWPIAPKNSSNMDAPVFSSPVIADVDGDGELEIVFSYIWDVQIYNVNGTLQERLNTFFTVVSSPAIGDTDGDGKAEIWIGGGDDREKSQGYLWRFESTDDLGATPWPMFQRDPRHTSLYPSPPKLAVAQTDLLSIVEIGTTSYTTYIRVTNSGGSPLSWSVDRMPGLVTQIRPSTGALAPGQSEVLRVTINSRDLTLGTQSIGDVIIMGNNTPLTIRIQVLIALEVFTINLPMSVRN